MMQLNRRNFLRAGIALPLMQSLPVIGAGGVSVPRRIMFICNTLGFHPDFWNPEVEGDLSSSAYLGGMRTQHKMSVLGNFFHPGMETSNHLSEKSFLTGAMYPEAGFFCNTTSIDQLLSEKRGFETRFPHLSLSLLNRSCSWNKLGSLVAPIHDEKVLFNRLFGKVDKTAKRASLERDRTIAEMLHRDIKHLGRHASPEDAGKLNEYVSVLQELELQIKHQNRWLKTDKPEVANPIVEDAQYPFEGKIRNMLKLSALAFQTDSTRVITLNLPFTNNHAITVPGLKGKVGWHQTSHHSGNPQKIATLKLIEESILRNLDEFIFDLDQIKEENGTLLDNTLVVMGSNMGNASGHTHNNLPILLAGGGIKHVEHHREATPTPLCNLYLEILNEYGLPTTKFGTSTGASSLLTKS
ncbi:MAG: hypothetical protein ACI9TH_003962 [Kiritimatiellia bacterium]|jgi:hypothetical protein